MNKFKINNIYNEDGKTIEEIISTFLSNFLDDEFNFNSMNKLDTILNN